MTRAAISKGDKVMVLDDPFSGVVVEVSGNSATIKTDDGFEMTYFVNELIKVHDSSILNKSTSKIDLDSKNKDVPKPGSSVPKSKVKGEIPPPIFDLHIEKLVKNWKRLSNYEILSTQTETAKRHIEFALRNRIPKIILIHGVGEGVLKAELDFMLARYDNLDFREASFQKYGQGATEVIFRQPKA